MVSEEIAAHMRATGANIVALGDHGQLPPANGRPAFTAPDITSQEIPSAGAGIANYQAGARGASRQNLRSERIVVIRR
jgi:hypothetical protein